jgi:hypothetical protein
VGRVLTVDLEVGPAGLNLPNKRLGRAPRGDHHVSAFPGLRAPGVLSRCLVGGSGNTSPLGRPRQVLASLRRDIGGQEWMHLGLPFVIG